MIESKEKGSHLPYRNLVIKILEETWFNFEYEEFMEETTMIGISVLSSMQYELKYGKVTKMKLSNKKKREAKNQEVPIEMDNSDNSPYI